MINNNYTSVQPSSTTPSLKDDIKQSEETKSAQEARRRATRSGGEKDPYKIDVAKEMSYAPPPLGGVLTPSPEAATVLANGLHDAAVALAQGKENVNVLTLPNDYSASQAGSSDPGHEVNAFVQILLFIAESLGKFYGVSAQAAQETAELTAKQFQMQSISLSAQLESADLARTQKRDAADRLPLQALMSAFSIVSSATSAFTSARAAHAQTAQFQMENLGSPTTRVSVNDAKTLSPELEGLDHLPKGQNKPLTQALGARLDETKEGARQHTENEGPHERTKAEKFLSKINPFGTHDSRAANAAAHRIRTEKLVTPATEGADDQAEVTHAVSAREQIQADSKVTKAATEKLEELQKNPAAVDVGPGEEQTPADVEQALKEANLLDSKGNLTGLAGTTTDGERILLSPYGNGKVGNGTKVFAVTVVGADGKVIKKEQDLCVTLKTEIADGKRLDALMLKTKMPTDLNYDADDLEAAELLKARIDFAQEPVGEAVERVKMMKKAYDPGTEAKPTHYAQSVKKMKLNAEARMQYAQAMQHTAQCLVTLTQGGNQLIEREKEIVQANAQMADTLTGTIGENWRNRTNANDAIIAAQNKVTSEVLDGVARALTSVFQAAAQAAQNPR